MLAKRYLNIIDAICIRFSCVGVEGGGGAVGEGRGGEVMVLTWTHFSVTTRLPLTLCGDSTSMLNPMALSGASRS